jgi:phage repressor protein C with HTH and peptisase S24 domain
MNNALKSVYSIRLENTRQLLAKSGLKRADFSEKIRVDYVQLSHYIGKNPIKNIGDMVARIESSFNLPEGYLDHEHEEESNELHGNVTNSNLKNDNLPIVEYVGVVKQTVRYVPVKAHSRMGLDGFYMDMGYPGGAGDGWIPSISAGPRAFAVKGTGGSMHPAIRDGWFAVCDPDANPVPTEYVQVCLKDGRCTIKEFISQRDGYLHLLSVNDGQRFTFELSEVESITAITEIVPPSRRVLEYPHLPVKG